ncbi:MAG TPA: hypothetical protein VKH19_11285 [Gemmatimonadaceae bacterium]|nr:hypothetical protein [Gemmatimonadaceae bacterium]
MHERGPGPALEDRAVGLAEAPGGVAFDAQRVEHGGGNPRQLGADVDQDRLHAPPFARTSWILDRDIHAEGPHIAGHNCS